MGAAGAAGEKTYVEDVFSTYLYIGNGSTQTITNDIDLAGEGGLVWTKNRSSAVGHSLIDTVRGLRYQLDSASTSSGDDLGTNPSFQAITAFNADGYNLGADGFAQRVNQSGENYASWTFRKAPKFFDVVTYTGDGTNNRQIPHNLGSTPGFIILKKASTTGFWICYHRSLASGDYLVLNLTNASNNVTSSFPEVTSSYFVPTSYASGWDYNDNGTTYVAYLFAHDAGGFGDSGNDNVISCGSYTGNGSTTGPVVTLGWEPQWVLVKGSTFGGYGWRIVDSMRGITTGGYDPTLSPNTSGVEISNEENLELTPTGFQIKSTNNGWNSSGDTYIYIAIRRGPMKTPEDATKVFSSVTFNSDVFNGTKLQSACLTDWFFIANRNGGFNTYNRLTTRSLFPYSTSAEGSVGYSFDLMDGVISTGTNFFATDLLRYHFRRAPGFFDVVAYTGTGSNRTLNHNLGVVPELIIAKKRSASENWPVYAASEGVGSSSGLRLNATDGSDYSNTSRFYQVPTATEFYVGNDSDINASGATYIFATCPGVSKVGSYTGTGTTLDVDCGFTAGARFVLIKRTDSTGDWYVWDTARGIVSGNDPYLLLNSTAAEVTNTDYIDPLDSGFQISSTAPAAINANGGSFIFLAIA
jgi:hypothetical protein